MKPNNSDIEFRNGPGSNQDLGDNTVWCLCCGHRADPLEAACSRRLATGRISRLWATFTGFHSFFHPNLIVHTMVHMMQLTTVPFLMSLFVASNGFGVLPRIYSKFPLTIVSFLALFLKIELFVRAVSSSQPSSSNVNIESRPSLPKVSFSGKTATGPSGPTLPADGEDLSFLEASPYWDQSNIPLNLAKQKNPFVGKIISAQSIVGPNAPGDICNIVIDHRGCRLNPAIPLNFGNDRISYEC